MKINLVQQLPIQYKELIAVWRQQSGKTGPADRLSETEARELGRTVREISRGLTGERLYAAERYMNEPQFLGAYLLYYWPVSFAQLINVLNRLSGQVVKALDFGCGPGPLTKALALAGCREITAVDRARPALQLTKALLAGSKSSLVTLQQNLEQPLKITGRDYDLVVCGHVLNELWKDDGERIAKRVQLLQKLMEVLKENGRLIVLEPALLSTARELLAVRDLLLAAGCQVEYPCILQAGCPCLNSEKATCHSEFAWQLPHSVKKIAEEAGFDKSSIKTAVLVFRRKGASRYPAGSWRIVSERMLAKSGKLRVMICGVEGRLSLSFKPSDIPSELEKSFRRLKRGDLITFKGAEKRDNGYELMTHGVLQFHKEG